MLASTSKNTLAAILTLFIAVLGNQAFAEEMKVQCAPTPLPNDCVLYLSDRAQDSCSNLDVFADLLYWHATQSVDWAFVSYIASNDMQTHSFRDVTFGWDPGFRVGVGYNMEHDDWDTQFSYTFFRTRTSDYIQPGPTAIKPAFWGATTALATTYLSAQLHWNINFNMFDWDLGRAFWLGKDLSVRPFIGLKGGLIDQTIYTGWQNSSLGSAIIGEPFAATEDLQQNFRGVGPKGGLNGKWILGNRNKCRFSLIGDFAAGFLWGHWQFSDHYKDNLLVTVNTNAANSNFGALTAQIFLGLGLDFNFRRELSHFSLKMGYEVQDWFEAYQLFDDNTGQHSNALLLQGLTIDCRLDY